MPGPDAIDMALRLTRQPGGQRKMALGGLPGNMIELLKVAAEDPDTMARLSFARGVAPSVLLDSARFALQKIILESGADHYRALGLARGASAIELRDHKRLLLKWLHPDRNHNAWESALFLRVQEAVEKLEAGATEPASSSSSASKDKQKKSRLDERKKARSVTGFRPAESRGRVLLRNAGIPALTIAAAAASIYLASIYGPSGAVAKDSLFSLLQWQKP
jgi:hypothetical protein